MQAAEASPLQADALSIFPKFLINLHESRRMISSPGFMRFNILLSFFKLVFAYSAMLTGEILGKFIPKHSLLLFIVDPTAYGADIFH